MYYANFNVNNGNRLSECLTDTNKFRHWKIIKDLAKAECFKNSIGSVWVYRSSDDTCAFHGYIKQGIVFATIYNFKSKF